MPECIVCKGYYETGKKCSRCDADQSAWIEWRRKEAKLGSTWAILHFLEPHLGLPLIITAGALIAGLLGIVWFWRGIKPYVSFMVVTLTLLGCILSIQVAYGSRFALRERELLRRVRRGWRKGLGTVEQASLTLAVAFILIWSITLITLQSEMVWETLEWLILEPPAVEETTEQGEMDFKEKLARAFPLLALEGYVAFVAVTYSSSLMLAYEYARELNDALPHPIFLQDEKLAEIVRREAEKELGRDPKGPDLMNVMGYVKIKGQPGPKILNLVPGLSTGIEESSPPQAELWSFVETWMWDEVKRTDDGGIEMKVARQEMYQLPKPNEGADLTPTPRVSYTVRADPWGRVMEITRDDSE